MTRTLPRHHAVRVDAMVRAEIPVDERVYTLTGRAVPAPDRSLPVLFAADDQPAAHRYYEHSHAWHLEKLALVARLSARIAADGDDVTLAALADEHNELLIALEIGNDTPVLPTPPSRTLYAFQRMCFLCGEVQRDLPRLVDSLLDTAVLTPLVNAPLPSQVE